MKQVALILGLAFFGTIIIVLGMFLNHIRKTKPGSNAEGDRK